MPLLIENSLVFYHCPKTGGTWVREALKNAGLNLHEIIFPLFEGGVSGDQVIPINDIVHMLPTKNPCTDFITFSFVRHPLTWLQSTFKYLKKEGWNEEQNPIQRNIKSDTFKEFIIKYTSLYQGEASRQQLLYANPFLSLHSEEIVALSEKQKEILKSHAMDYVGRCENLVEDLLIALASLNLSKAQKETIRNTPKANVSDLSIDVEYDEEMKALVLNSEKKLIDLYYV